MGLFSRIRGSSTHPSTTSQRPTTPLPSEPSGSIAEDEITPKAKEKKAFSIWKGKGKADPSVAGRRYEDHSIRGNGQANGHSGRAGNRLDGPRQSGAWDRDSIYSERPASPLDPPSRIWGQAAERQRSASALGIHPPSQGYGYHAEAQTPQPQFQSLRDPQYAPRSPERQRYSSDMPRIPPPSPSSIRTAPMNMPSNANRPYPSHPHFSGENHFAPPARDMGDIKGANRIEIPKPPMDGGFLGKLTFEDKSTRRTGLAQRREREPSWLVGSVDDGSGLFGFGTTPNAASNSSLASSGEVMNHDGQPVTPAAVPKSAHGGSFGIQAETKPLPPLKQAPTSPVSPISLSRPSPAPPTSTRAAPPPTLPSPPAPMASPSSAPFADLDVRPEPPMGTGATAAPSAWKPEVVQAVAETTALPPSLPPSSISSPIIEQDEDKKGKFWKARGRRSSKAMSDLEHELAAPAESPASATRPTDTSRPPQLRRPSSSFFARPFNRVSSRTSVFDLEPTPVDDKSFQLKGFRHVSGVSGLQDDPNADKDKAETIVEPPARDADDWKPIPPSRPTMSRPSSAASVRTLDEMSASKVSVAAFKRGIRRPSETIDKADKSLDEDEDDDVPLGMLNRGSIPRPASSASISRMASPQVASPVSSSSALPRPYTIHTNSYDLKSELASPEHSIGLGLPSSSPVPNKDDPEWTTSGRTASGAFVVKSAKSTRSLQSMDSSGRDGRSMRSVTPDTRCPSIPPRSAEQSHGPTRSASPTSSRKPVQADEEEIIVSPAKPKAVPSYRVDDDGEGIEDTDAAAYIRSRTASPTPGPAMVPLGLPLPQESPSMAEMQGLNLPPRPDEMEEEPVSPRSMNSTMSPRARISSVVDPLKRLSGFLSSTSLNKAAHEDDEGFDTSLALHGMVFAEQDGKADNLTEKSPSTSVSSSSNGHRMDLQDRLNAIKPTVSRIQTAMPPMPANGGEAEKHGQKDEQAGPTVRTHMSALAGQLTPIASQEGSSGEDLSSVPSDNRAKPFGPRQQPPAAAAVPSQSNDASPTIQLDDADSADASDDESSDEETLAQLKTRASRSTLNLSRPPPVRDDASSASSSPRTARARLASPSLNDLALGPVTSRMSSSSSPSRPKMSISPSESSHFVRPGMLHTQSSKSSLTPSSSSGQAGGALPISPSGKSVSFADHKEQHSYLNSSTSMPTQAQMHTQSQMPTTGTRGRMAYTMHDAQASASPASSQSGLTGDSVLGPVTPGEGSVVSVNRSRERPGMSSSQSSFSLNEDRQRRFSQASTTAASVAPTSDPATLHMMKQQWQAQFMAAAYAASEEQWERASSVGTAADPAPQNGYFGQQPMSMNMPFGFHMSGMPMQNQQQMMGMGMPFGMQYPGMNMPMMAGMASMGMPMGMQFPYGMVGQGMPGMSGMNGMPGISMPSSPQLGAGGMYNYGPGAQSVFGGEFGPPTGHRGHGSPDARSVSASTSGHGINGTSYVSSPLAQPPHGSSGSVSRPSGSRHSRSTSNLRAQSASSVYGTASSGNVAHTRPRHHSNACSISALPTIQQSPQKDSPNTPRQSSYSNGPSQSPLRPGPRAQSGTGDGTRHSSYDLLSAPAPPSSWRNGSGASDVGRARPRTHFAS